MQDKNNITNIDEQFTDLGWEKMQGVLDKEMPTEPVRKYRMGWLWLLLFLGILAGGVYYNFATKNTTPTNEIPDTTIANVIENTIDVTTLETENKTTDEVAIKDETQYSNDENQPKGKAIISPKNIIKKENKENIVKNNLHIVKENNFINKNIKQASRIDDFSRRDLTTKVVSTKRADMPVISEKEQMESLPSAPMENQVRNSFVTIERIASLSPQIANNNNALLQTSPNFDPIPKTRKFSQTYSLLAGVQSDEFSDFAGIKTGFLAHYRFTPKIGMETGLFYTNTKKNIDTDVDYTEKISEEYPGNMEQYRKTASDTLNLHYLRLPLSFTYQPHPKIQLYTGLNAGYRLSKNSNTSSDALSQTNANIYDAQFSDDTYQSSFNVNITINEEVDTYGVESTDRITVPYSFTIRKADLTAQGGFRYYPIARLGIDVSYQQGLLNMTKNTTTNLNSGFQLALVWQLHR